MAEVFIPVVDEAHSFQSSQGRTPEKGFSSSLRSCVYWVGKCCYECFQMNSFDWELRLCGTSWLRGIVLSVVIWDFVLIVLLFWIFAYSRVGKCILQSTTVTLSVVNLNPKSSENLKKKVRLVIYAAFT